MHRCCRPGAKSCVSAASRLSTRGSLLKLHPQRSVGTPRHRHQRKSQRKGREGEAWSSRGLGQDPQPHLRAPLVGTCTGCYAPPFSSQLSVIISISPRTSLPPPRFLCSPSLPRACSPPPRLTALGSSNLGSPGDGQRERGALQLWSHRSPRPRFPEPPPPLSPPGFPPTPALLLGQRRHRLQLSSRPRRAALTRPGWRFPLLGST